MAIAIASPVSLPVQIGHRASVLLRECGESCNGYADLPAEGIGIGCARQSADACNDHFYPGSGCDVSGLLYKPAQPRAFSKRASR